MRTVLGVSQSPGAGGWEGPAQRTHRPGSGSPAPGSPEREQGGQGGGRAPSASQHWAESPARARRVQRDSAVSVRSLVGLEFQRKQFSAAPGTRDIPGSSAMLMPKPVPSRNSVLPAVMPEASLPPRAAFPSSPHSLLTSPGSLCPLYRKKTRALSSMTTGQGGSLERAPRLQRRLSPGGVRNG